MAPPGDPRYQDVDQWATTPTPPLESSEGSAMTRQVTRADKRPYRDEMTARLRAGVDRSGCDPNIRRTTPSVPMRHLEGAGNRLNATAVATGLRTNP